MKPQADRSLLIGEAVLIGIFLVAGIGYLIMTMSSFSGSVAVFYPVLCGGVLVVLLLVDVVVKLVGWRRTATPQASLRPVIGPAPGPAAQGEDTDAVTQVLEAEEESTTRWGVFVPLLLGTVAFAVLATQVDYLISTAIFMFGAVWFLDRRRFRWWVGLIAAIATPIAIYLLFVVVLHLRLPTIIPGL